MERPEITTGIAGIVLAAGAGSRFDPTGRRYKLTQSLPDGRTVIAAACEAMLPHVDTLDVVCRPERHDEIEQALIEYPVRLLPCAAADRGMGATIKHGIRATSPSLGWLIMLGDMPFVEADAIAVAATHIRQRAGIVRARYQGRPGHPVGFSRLFRDDLLALADEQGAAPLLRRRMTEIAWVDALSSGVLLDVDVPGDLARSPTRC